MLVRADMHIHSYYSDGRMSPREIILEAIYKDLRVIAVTDHNTFRGAVETLRLARGHPEAPLVIIGNEVRTDHGDVLVYCYEPINTPRSIPELIDEAHSNDCLVVPAHPFDEFRKGIGDLVYDYAELWDAIEVWNASASKKANRKALEAAKILDLPGLANSDAHIPEYIGIAYTLIEIGELSPEGVFKAIKDKNTIPHPGKPPFRLLLKRFKWSIGRRVKHRGRIKAVKETA